MSDTDLTPEESQALEAMKEPTPVEEPKTEPVEAAETTEPEKTEKTEEPEFKSQRKPPEGYVPHQAMHAERMKRQELEKQVEELRKAIEKPTDEAPKYVDPLEDPEGFRKYEEHRFKQTQDELQQYREQQQKQAELAQRQSDAAQQENDFRAKTEDYDTALEHLYNTRVQQLNAQGVYDQQEIQRLLSAQVNAIYDAAKATGSNFGQMLYMQAQAAGYTNTPQQTEEAKVTQLAEAQAKTQGLGTAGGGKQAGVLTMEQLANMSDAEYAKAMAEKPDEVRKAMGG